MAILVNICFFRGKIISKINFKFIVGKNGSLSNKHTSVCYFDIELDNSSIIHIKVYDNKGDLCYQKLKTGNVINFYGSLCQNHEVELYEFENYS